MNWYCVQTKAKKEEMVVTYCRDTLGVEVYFPRLQERKRIRRVRRVVTSPLFPRYFFCRFDFAAHHRAIRYAPDATGLVSQGCKPVVVDDAVIEQVKEWAGGSGYLQWRDPEFKPGDRVDIHGGPMEGMSGVVLSELSGSQRIAVLLSLVNCDARLVLDRSEVSSQCNG